MTLSLVLAALVVAIVFALSRGKEPRITWGPVLLGMALAFLLMGTVVGAPLQDFMSTTGNAAEGLITDLWRHLTS